MARSALPFVLSIAALACGGTTFDTFGTNGGSAAGAGAAADAASGGGAGGATGGAGAAADAASGGGAGGRPATGGAPGAGGATGGAPGMGGAAGAPGPVEGCTTAEDCTLFTDCCTCAPVNRGTTLPMCERACFQSDCDARGITASEVACVAGRCVFARTCNPAGVLCKSLPPTCGAGQAALVVGSCWGGGCVPVERCSDVASCDACTAAGLPCATLSAWTSTYHCVTTPTQCRSNPTCACMGVCSGSFQCTVLDSTDLQCVCPAC